MSVGEALVYGLLGGTKAASEHYVTDWRERTKEARHLASQKEGWDYQEKLKRETAKELADYKRAHKDKTVLYAASDDGNGLVPIAPDAKTGAMPIPVGQMTGDKFSFYGTGKSSKSGGGLLGGLGSSSNLTAGKMKLLNSTGQSVEVSVRQDKGGGLSFPEIGMDGSVTWRKVGKDISKEATAFAELYANEILSDTGLLGRYDTDELFKKYGVKTKSELEQKLIAEGQAKYLQQQFGQAVTPELPTVPISTDNPVIPSPNQSQVAVDAVPENTPAQQPQTTGNQLTVRHIQDLREGKIDPDTFKQVFGEEAYNRYVKPLATDQTAQPVTATPAISTETADVTQPTPHEVGTIIPGHSPGISDYFRSWLKPDYATHKKQQEKLEREYHQRKSQEALKRDSVINTLKSDRDNIIATMNDPHISIFQKFKLADELAETNNRLRKLSAE